jgi:hypothetical protein
MPPSFDLNYETFSNYSGATPPQKRGFRKVGGDRCTVAEKSTIRDTKTVSSRVRSIDATSLLETKWGFKPLGYDE